MICAPRHPAKAGWLRDDDRHRKSRPLSEADYRAQLRYQVVVLDISREDFIGQLASATDRFLNREVFGAGVRCMRAARRRPACPPYCESPYWGGRKCRR